MQNLARRIPTKKDNEKAEEIHAAWEEWEGLVEIYQGKRLRVQRKIDPLRNKREGKLTVSLKCLLLNRERNLYLKSGKEENFMIKGH